MDLVVVFVLVEMGGVLFEEIEGREVWERGGQIGVICSCKGFVVGFGYILRMYGFFVVEWVEYLCFKVCGLNG